MAKIDAHTEQRIKDSADIVDVVGAFVQLDKRGKDYHGLCPFHDDRKKGNFVVSPGKNQCSCFACGITGLDPIGFLMKKEGMSYADALRWIGKQNNIMVDDKVIDTSPIEVKRRKQPDLITWPLDMAKVFIQYNANNPLVQYLLKLPLIEQDKQRLIASFGLYLIGTYPQGEYAGWTIWWYVDADMRVRTGKMMAYNADGHRDKTKRSNGHDKTTWVHSEMLYQKKWSDKTHEVRICLFGEHLLDIFPDAIVNLVESEKTALICSAFCNPKEQIWLATGGKSGFTADKVKSLIEKKRRVLVHPDIDGFEEWQRRVDVIGYKRMTVSQLVKKRWTEKDGPKADIADIMIRIVTGDEETEVEKLARIWGQDELPQPLQKLITSLDLKIDK